jgi:hypothetical protein
MGPIRPAPTHSKNAKTRFPLTKKAKSPTKDTVRDIVARKEKQLIRFMNLTSLGATGKSATLLALLALNAAAGTLYVDIHSTNPVPPYSDWSTAATNIQDAVDAASTGDLVLANDGVYQTGGRVIYGRMTNRVAVTKAITLRSVNGPDATTIKGYQVPTTTNGDSAVRCVYLTNGAVLAGFTLTSGATRAGGNTFKEGNGAGVWCETNGAAPVVSNCFLIGNSASSQGGGSSYGTLSNCVLAGNYAFVGGGAYFGILNNCTLTNNSAPGCAGGIYGGTIMGSVLAGNSSPNGGGAYASILLDCIISSNTSQAQGGGVHNCSATNCLLSGNSAGMGGGALNSTLDRCMVISNTAAFLSSFYPGYGGGAAGGSLNNCTLVGNSSARSGGGADNCTLSSCTLVGNSALGSGGQGVAGGALACTLYNCVAYDNSGASSTNFSASSLYYCCTMPMPTNGIGNFTNSPLFIDQANGNFRLQANSPGINAGNNAYVSSATDFDGNQRISGGTVDVGAYEFQNPASTISYAWLKQYGLPMDGTADAADSDHDGLSNWQEWRAGTDPTNAVSVLQMLSPTNCASGLTVTWQSVTNRNYYLQRSLDLSAQPPFVNVRSNIVGQAGTTGYTDTGASGPGPFFYRVGVQ